MSHDSIQVIIASGPKEPKRVLLGLSMAAAAATTGTAVNLFLVMDGTQCLSVDYCRRELMEGYPTIAELLSVIKESGGVVEYCPSCVPESCDASLARPVAATDGSCGCIGIPAGLASYGMRLADQNTVIF